MRKILRFFTHVNISSVDMTSFMLNISIALMISSSLYLIYFVLIRECVISVIVDEMKTNKNNTVADKIMNGILMTSKGVTHQHTDIKNLFKLIGNKVKINSKSSVYSLRIIIILN